MPEVFKVILGKFKSFFIRHIKFDEFIVSSKLAQTDSKRAYFYIRWLKTLETETHMHSWWIPGIFQSLNIVISGKIINIHKYANEII
jgi:hypothetical protein